MNIDYRQSPTGDKRVTEVVKGKIIIREHDAAGNEIDNVTVYSSTHMPVFPDICIDVPLDVAVEALKKHVGEIDAKAAESIQRAYDWRVKFKQTSAAVLHISPLLIGLSVNDSLVSITILGEV